MIDDSTTAPLHDELVQNSDTKDASTKTGMSKNDDIPSCSRTEPLQPSKPADSVQHQDLPEASCVEAAADPATRTVLESQAQRYVSALKGLNASLIEISAPLPPFGRSVV